MYCFFQPVCWLDSKDPVEKSEVLEKWQSLWICAVLYGSTWNLYFYKICIKIIFLLDSVAQGKVRTLTPRMNALSRAAPLQCWANSPDCTHKEKLQGSNLVPLKVHPEVPWVHTCPSWEKKRNFLTPRVKGIGEEYLMMVALTITPLDSRNILQNW